MTSSLCYPILVVPDRKLESPPASAPSSLFSFCLTAGFHSVKQHFRPFVAVRSKNPATSSKEQGHSGSLARTVTPKGVTLILRRRELPKETKNGLSSLERPHVQATEREATSGGRSAARNTGRVRSRFRHGTPGLRPRSSSSRAPSSRSPSSRPPRRIRDLGMAERNLVRRRRRQHEHELLRGRCIHAHNSSRQCHSQHPLLHAAHSSSIPGGLFLLDRPGIPPAFGSFALAALRGSPVLLFQTRSAAKVVRNFSAASGVYGAAFWQNLRACKMSRGPYVILKGN